MRVTLIHPPNLLPSESILSVRAPTPGVSIPYLIATLRKAGHEARAIDALGLGIERVRQLPGTDFYLRGLTADEIVERIPPNTDIIGLSCMFSNEWLYCKEILRAIAVRFPAVPILVGGEHITADTDLVLQGCPFLYCAVLGEAEETLIEIVEAIRAGRGRAEINGISFLDESGRLVRTVARKRIQKIDEIPWPAWDEIPLENYFAVGAGITTFQGRVLPILASRGCPYECTFCSNPTMWGLRWTSRDPEDVIREMKHNIRRYGITHFEFHDLTAIVNRAWILRFTSLLAQENLGVTWSLPSGTRSEAIDQEVVEGLLRSGCKKISYAPESGSEATLKRIKKKVKISKMIQSMKCSIRAGILVRAHIIIGFPDQTRGEVWDSLKFIFTMAWIGVHDVSIYFFAPYPGSELFRDLRARGRIPTEPAAYERFLAGIVVNNFAETRSWSDHLTNRELKLVAWGGMGAFYFFQFLFRPWRLFGLASRFLKKQPTTILDGLLYGLVWSKASQMRAEAA